MNNKQYVIFAVICVFLLVVVFFVWAINGIGILAPVTEGLYTDKNQIKDDTSDLFITPASKLYYSLIRDSDPLRGSSKSKLIIMEFGDFECPYCQAESQELAKILAAYQGKIALVWKDFPNPSHLNAKEAALAARCAQNQGKFWQYHDYLFVNQKELSRGLYNQIALEISMDLSQFNKCLDSSERIESVGQGLIDGQKLRVDATPYLFIGNKRYNYALTYEELKQIIDQELDSLK